LKKNHWPGWQCLHWQKNQRTTPQSVSGFLESRIWFSGPGIDKNTAKRRRVDRKPTANRLSIIEITVPTQQKPKRRENRGTKTFNLPGKCTDQASFFFLRLTVAVARQLQNTTAAKFTWPLRKQSSYDTKFNCQMQRPSPNLF
jgi:hypothetical protein